MEQVICTTQEQSKVLLDAGIDPHTADMTWHYTKSRIKALEWELKPHKPQFFEGDAVKRFDLISKFGNDFSKKMGFKRPDYDAKTQYEQLYGKDVPAWSFMALLKLLPKHIEKDGVRYDLRINWNDDEDFLYYVNANRKTLKFERRATPDSKDLLDSLVIMLTWLFKWNFLVPYKKE